MAYRKSEFNNLKDLNYEKSELWIILGKLGRVYWKLMGVVKTISKDSINLSKELLCKDFKKGFQYNKF